MVWRVLMDLGCGGSWPFMCVGEDGLNADDSLARADRDDSARHGVTLVHLVGAPGSGKTSLLERAIEALQHEVALGVLEGGLDADRMARFDVAVARIDAPRSRGGEGPFDAGRVRRALRMLPLEELDLVVVESVGNLLSPAEIRVGEDLRVTVAPVAEGEDQPLKHPRTFRASDLVLVNKTDLLPHLDYDLHRFLANLDDVHPDAPRFLTSAKSGEGVDSWVGWLREAARSRRAHGDRDRGGGSRR